MTNDIAEVRGRLKAFADLMTDDIDVRPVMAIYPTPADFRADLRALLAAYDAAAIVASGADVACRERDEWKSRAEAAEARLAGLPGEEEIARIIIDRVINGYEDMRHDLAHDAARARLDRIIAVADMALASLEAEPEGMEGGSVGLASPSAPLSPSRVSDTDREPAGGAE